MGVNVLDNFLVGRSSLLKSPLAAWQPHGDNKATGSYYTYPPQNGHLSLLEILLPLDRVRLAVSPVSSVYANLSELAVASYLAYRHENGIDLLI